MADLLPAHGLILHFVARLISKDVGLQCVSIPVDAARDQTYPWNIHSIRILGGGQSLLICADVFFFESGACAARGAIANQSTGPRGAFGNATNGAYDTPRAYRLFCVPAGEHVEGLCVFQNMLRIGSRGMERDRGISSVTRDEEALGTDEVETRRKKTGTMKEAGIYTHETYLWGLQTHTRSIIMLSSVMISGH